VKPNISCNRLRFAINQNVSVDVYYNLFSATL